MEPLAIGALVTSIIASLTALIAIIKRSKCCGGFCSFETRTPQTVSPKTTLS